MFWLDLNLGWRSYKSKNIGEVQSRSHILEVCLYNQKLYYKWFYTDVEVRILDTYTIECTVFVETSTMIPFLELDPSSNT